MWLTPALWIDSIHKTTVFGINYNKNKIPQSSDPEAESGNDGRRHRRRRCCCCGRRRRPDVGLEDICIPFPWFVPLPEASEAVSFLPSPLPLAVDVDGLELGFNDGDAPAVVTCGCGEFGECRLIGTVRVEIEGDSAAVVAVATSAATGPDPDLCIFSKLLLGSSAVWSSPCCCIA